MDILQYTVLLIFLYQRQCAICVMITGSKYLITFLSDSSMNISQGYFRLFLSTDDIPRCILIISVFDFIGMRAQSYIYLLRNKYDYIQWGLLPGKSVQDCSLKFSLITFLSFIHKSSVPCVILAFAGFHISITTD